MKTQDGSIIYFNNDKNFKIKISSDILDRQFFNCLKLEKMLKSRQENA